MRVTRRAIAVSLALLAISAQAVHADLEETERRLKRAGVDAELRAKINESIRRGARWLSSTQNSDGSFPRGAGRVEILCALALQHAAATEAQAAYRRSLKYMLAGKGKLHESIYRETYQGGLAALLLHAEGKHPEVVRKLGAAFAYGEGAHGFWGYSNAVLSGKGAGNLSTSQFAVLALWAAARAGYAPDAGVWTRHVDYLLRSQTLDGSFGYGPTGLSYPTGTFMGLANLVVAEQAIRKRLDADSQINVAVARRRAEAALARDVPATIAAFRTGRIRDYYALYAMEKACLFLDREEVGGVRWYVEGAKALLAAQQADGRWPSRDYRYWLYGSRAVPAKVRGRRKRSGARDDRNGKAKPRGLAPVRTRDMESTAFALLFLLRSWESFHPTTPRDLHTPTTTPSAPAKPAPKPSPAKPAPGNVPLPFANSLLDELENRLRKPGGVPELLTSLRHVGDAYARLDASPEQADNWRRRAESLLLTAFGRSPAVALVAASVLGHTHPRVVPRMIRIADKVRFPEARRARDPAIYAPVFGALARLNAEEALGWMLERHLISTGAPQAIPRCSAALRAAVRFRDVSGQLRHDIVDRLVQGYASMERSASGAGKSGASWRKLSPAVILAVQHFARDADGLPPLSRNPTGGWVIRMREFREWLRDHDDAKKQPWR